MKILCMCTLRSVCQIGLSVRWNRPVLDTTSKRGFYPGQNAFLCPPTDCSGAVHHGSEKTVRYSFALVSERK